MASWSDLRNYIQSKYQIEKDDGNVLTMIFASGSENRSQVVTVRHAVLGNGEEWVTVDSPIGQFSEVDLTRAVQLAGDIVCGGISAVGEWVTLRDSFPLANLDPNEFEGPLHLVTGTADTFEEKLTGKDLV